MAYGKGAAGKDGNRGLHGETYAGEEPTQIDTSNTVGSFAVPKNMLLGQQTGANQSRQAMPNPDLNLKLDVSSQVNGEKELLGQGTTDETVVDPDYPNMGTVTNPHMPDGYQPADWNSVAPYEYPEFPMPAPKGENSLPMPFA